MDLEELIKKYDGITFDINGKKQSSFKVFRTNGQIEDGWIVCNTFFTQNGLRELRGPLNYCEFENDYTIYCANIDSIKFIPLKQFCYFNELDINDFYEQLKNKILELHPNYIVDYGLPNL